MTIITEKYVRKPIEIQAVQVTDENMQEIAEWCKGQLRVAVNPRGTREMYIKVQSIRPITERQTMAFTGDWVLYAAPGFRVYTDNAFTSHFEKVPEEQPMDLLVSSMVETEPCD